MLIQFIDYIGLIDPLGAYDQSPSGLYMNTLPGLTLENIDLNAEPEQRTWKGVWADVQKEAVLRFRLDILNELRKCLRINKKCDYDALIQTDENMELLSQAWKYLLGFQLMWERLNSSRLNRYTTVDRKLAERLQKDYHSEYLVYLEQAAQLLNLDECEDDLECGGNPETVIYMP